MEHSRERMLLQLADTMHSLENRLLAAEEKMKSMKSPEDIQELEKRLKDAEEAMENLKSDKDNIKALCAMVVDISMKFDLEVPIDDLFPSAVEEVRKSSSYKFSVSKFIGESPYFDIPSVLLGNLKDNIDTKRSGLLVSKAVALYLSECTNENTEVLPFVCDPTEQNDVVSANADYFSKLKSREDLTNIVGIIHNGLNYTTCFAEKAKHCWYCNYVNDTKRSADAIFDDVTESFARSLTLSTGFMLGENEMRLVNSESNHRFKSSYCPNDLMWFQSLSVYKTLDSIDSVLDSIRIAFEIVMKSPNSRVDRVLYQSLNEILNQFDDLLAPHADLDWFMEISCLEFCYQVVEKLILSDSLDCALSLESDSTVRNDTFMSHLVSLVKLERASLKNLRLGMVRSDETHSAASTSTKRAASASPGGGLKGKGGSVQSEKKKRKKSSPQHPKTPPKNHTQKKIPARRYSPRFCVADGAKQEEVQEEVISINDSQSSEEDDYHKKDADYDSSSEKG